MLGVKRQNHVLFIYSFVVKIKCQQKITCLPPDRNDDYPSFRQHIYIRSALQMVSMRKVDGFPIPIVGGEKCQCFSDFKAYM